MTDEPVYEGIQELFAWVKVIHFPDGEKLSFIVYKSHFNREPNHPPNTPYTMNNLAVHYTLHPCYVDYDTEMTFEEWEELRAEQEDA